MRIFSLIFIIMLLAAAFSSPANADCANPAGAESKIYYNADIKVLQYCDGANWIAMHPPGSGGGGCANPAKPEGRMVYNADNRVMQGCGGNIWRAMGPVGGTGAVEWHAPQQAINNPGPTADDRFGTSVAVSGTIAVIGAHQDDPGGVSSAGAAYVFDTTDGSLIATLNNPDPTGSDRFGVSVAVNGTIAVIGTYLDDPGGVLNAGTAYVFDATNGSLIATLNNPDPTADDFFGRTVAVSGTIAVIGADNDDPGGVLNAGAAYVFNVTNGSLIATLNNPDPTASDRFGTSVAVSGTTAVVGAHLDDPGGVSGAGTAYVFNTTDGSLIATLNNPAPAADDQFGFSVAVSGTVAVIGAFQDDPGGVIDAGTAYVFNTTDGSLIATLNNPDPTATDRLGWGVAVSGTIAVVGAHLDDPSGVSAAGTVYAFDTTNGALIATLNNPAPAAGDNFGVSVAVSGTTAVVGAHSDDPGGVIDAGTAYVSDIKGSLYNPAPAADDLFGASVAVSGTVAVVGAEQDDPGGVSAAGAAYVFDTTNGSLIATLNNPDPTASDLFGTSVAVSGTIAVVVADFDDPGGVIDAGTAYVFDTTNGSLIATLNNPDPTASDRFGRSVAVSGTIAVVGAHQDDPGGVSGAGTAYVFDTTDGSLIATLNNPAPAVDDRFGNSVAVSGTVVVVGAAQDDPGGVSSAGTAYVFDTTNGSLIATLNNPDPTASDLFGTRVAVSGSVAVVGAHRDDPGGVSGAGTAYVFDITDGSLIATLNNPDPTTDDLFGVSVAVSGTVAVVGAFQDDPGGVSAAGTAYVFDTTDGSLIATLNNPDPTTDDLFGASVAVSGTVAVVGASGDDPGGVSAAGTAYVFLSGGVGACVSPYRRGGTLLYNGSSNVMQYCDGVNWVAIGKTF